MASINIKNITKGKNLAVSFMENKIPAGFPSPAQGENSDSIDLNKELIHSPASTFCAKVTGDSMIGCGISDGDLIIIDKSIEPQQGNIAVCYIDGDFTVKRLSIQKGTIYLQPENAKYPPIKVPAESNFQIWGVVTYIIKKSL